MAAVFTILLSSLTLQSETRSVHQGGVRTGAPRNYRINAPVDSSPLAGIADQLVLVVADTLYRIFGPLAIVLCTQTHTDGQGKAKPWSWSTHIPPQGVPDIFKPSSWSKVVVSSFSKSMCLCV
jgi:hypothetical protein